ncbi:MAG: exodeoxyribonuclease III [Bacteroidia bacterium]
MPTSIISYNLNGIRAAAKKGFLDWLAQESPDILCIQETKAQPDQLESELIHPPGYHTYWYSAEKKGYSGVAIFTKQEPLHVAYGCGIEAYDSEGRILRADYANFSVVSAYFPSGSSGDHRQAIKEDFLRDIQPYFIALREQRPRLVIAGDYNIAHTEIDIHDPVGNKDSSGFLPHERAWLTEFVESGFIDSFRLLHPDVRHAYSWWSYRSRARENNKGWRIDYQMLTEDLRGHCLAASILPDVMHSDHCPIKIVLDMDAM